MSLHVAMLVALLAGRCSGTGTVKVNENVSTYASNGTTNVATNGTAMRCNQGEILVHDASKGTM